MNTSIPWPILAVTANLLFTHAQEGPTFLTHQHIDVLIRYEPEATNKLVLTVRDSSAHVSYATNEVVIQAAPSSELVLPAGTPFGNEGDPIWVLPQSQDPGLPYIGFSADAVPSGLFDGPLRYRLIHVEGPGAFFAWQAGIGALNVQMNTTDGIDANDQIELLAGGHAHYNLGFNAPGMYCVNLQAEGRRLGVATNDYSLPTPITFYLEPLPTAPPFLVWQRTHWPTCVPDDLKGPGADPDADMVVNAMEYALGLDPLIPNTAGLPAFTWITENDQTYGALTYSRVKDATDLEYLPGVTSNLLIPAWTPMTTVVSVEDLGDTERVTVRDPLDRTTAGKRFYQLRIRFLTP